MSLKSASLLIATISATVPAFAQQPAIKIISGQATVGDARFTLVSPNCIRLEYAPANGFVDAPTLFAFNRSARDAKAKITRTGAGVTIVTAKLRLVYQPDGKPFSATNLKVTFPNGAKQGAWSPGQKNPGNMGGPVPTLDFINRAVNLPDGLISRDGWSIIDDSGQAILNDNWIAPRPGGGPPAEKIDQKNSDLDWYLFAYGQNYHSAMQSLRLISGPAALPRKAVLGSWNSRWAKLSADDYRKMVRDYEEHDFPLDVVVMDMEWHTQKQAKSNLIWSNNPGWTGYTWDKSLIPDPEGLLQEFKNKGIVTTLNDHPHDGIREHEVMYPEFMKTLGLSDKEGINLPFKAGDKKYMDAFFAASHDPLEQQGTDFWWVDWQQDSLVPWVSGVPGMRHLPWLNELYFRQSEKGGLRGQNYSRWGGWGDQRHPLQFSGDTTSNWNVLAFEVPFTSTSANGGCFYWAHDTGGFFGGARNAEQYTRWTQFSGLSTSLRVHSAGEDRRPWLWGKQAEEAMRVTYRTRSELFPYIYTSARQCYDDMQPLLRPMYLDYPGQEAAYHSPGQYLYGDNLLVAPIVTPGVGPNFVAQQNVWFPEGSWYNYFSGEKFTGNTQALVTADLNETPLYVRAGVPVPMQPYTQRMATKEIDTLRLRCYPGENGETGTSSLYEDDGRSAAYKTGGFARTPLSYTRTGDRVEIKVGAVKGQFSGQLKSRAYAIELPETVAATKVSLTIDRKAQTLATKYNAATRTNTIAVPALAIGKAFTLAVVCAPANPETARSSAYGRRMEGIMGKLKEIDLVGGQSMFMGSPEQNQMILATQGIGIAKVMEGPNFRDNPDTLQFFAPTGLIKGDKLTLSSRSGKSQEVVYKGGVLPLGKMVSPRNATMVTFTIGNRTYTLPQTSNPLLTSNNVALDATVKASSTEGGYNAPAVNDGDADGYPHNGDAEWSSNGQKAGATMRLDWAAPQTIDRVVLFDRPNETDDITLGVLRFSDGTSVEVGAFPAGRAEVKFAPKAVTWMIFEVTGVKPGTVNAGLAEIAVYKANK